ncbi:MAG: helix-hairpin-helix domain-containing protein [Acidobacteria bacterium]|nr:helix-hairpin-helix domain-containing protein [Acidobacteriota bacterium]
MHSPTVLLSCILLILSAFTACTSRVRYETPPASCASGQINLNTATETQLVALPGIGGPTAKLILDLRSTNGNFRRPEQVLLIRGMSESRFLEFRSLVCAE